MSLVGGRLEAYWGGAVLLKDYGFASLKPHLAFGLLSALWFGVKV